MLVIDEDLLATKMLSKMTEYDMFLNFTTDACQAYGSVILRVGFCSGRVSVSYRNSEA